MVEKLLQLREQQQQHHNNHDAGGVKGIILSPTRELSNQTLRVLHKLIPRGTVNAVGIHGGEGMEKQFALLASNPDIIIATPGRLAHHLNEIPDFTIKDCSMFICDEADRLFEMGFAAQIRQIARKLPSHSVCQKVLVSATLPKALVEFSKSGFCVDPVVVRLDQEATVSDELRMAFVTCRSTEKDATLLHILQQHIRKPITSTSTNKEKNAFQTGLTLIFASTRHHVDYLHVLLQASNIPATCIYGSMDHQARQQNLLSFRHGETPILIVTDVAARGIDVPLIDHVIHYHFPASPKLFVHRSGRAARAGRIGYAWTIAEPDEMPYMVDLLLFLGRKLQTADEPYSLELMTPEMVHYGCVPESIITAEVENIQRILHSELTGSLESQDLQSLAKVCNNAMKQYRKTRPEASREAVRRAKAVLEGERNAATGQREQLVPIPPHPLLISPMSSSESKKGLQSLFQERQKYLEAMANFRPKETVFEALGSGKVSDPSIVSHVDKGRTTAANLSSNASIIAIKNMRRQMRIVRDKGHLVVAGSGAADETLDTHDVNDEGLPDPRLTKNVVADEMKIVPETKRRLSKAERKRRKMNTGTAAEITTKEKKPNRDFRDPTFFMNNDFSSNDAVTERSRRVEAAMQPSAANTTKATKNQALRMEEAMLDIVGDENDELIKKQRMMRWDKAKRKYVSTTVGMELSGDSRSKKVKLESGQIVKNSKLKLGELYQKWQKKCNRSIGRTGVFDSETTNEQDRAQPEHDSKSPSSKKEKGSDREAPMTAVGIKKEREQKNKQKLKNMKKSERRKLESQAPAGKTGKAPGNKNTQWKNKKAGSKRR